MESLEAEAISNIIDVYKGLLAKKNKPLQDSPLIGILQHYQESAKNCGCENNSMSKAINDKLQEILQDLPADTKVTIKIHELHEKQNPLQDSQQDSQQDSEQDLQQDLQQDSQQDFDSEALSIVTGISEETQLTDEQFKKLIASVQLAIEMPGGKSIREEIQQVITRIQDLMVANPDIPVMTISGIRPHLHQLGDILKRANSVVEKQIVDKVTARVQAKSQSAKKHTVNRATTNRSTTHIHMASARGETYVVQPTDTEVKLCNYTVISGIYPLQRLDMVCEELDNVSIEPEVESITLQYKQVKRNGHQAKKHQKRTNQRKASVNIKASAGEIWLALPAQMTTRIVNLHCDTEMLTVILPENIGASMHFRVYGAEHVRFEYYGKTRCNLVIYHVDKIKVTLEGKYDVVQISPFIIGGTATITASDCRRIIAEDPLGSTASVHLGGSSFIARY